MSDRVIYIVRSWPRLSQTFIVNEVLALERRGLELVVFSLVRLRRGRGPAAGRRRARSGALPRRDARPGPTYAGCCRRFVVAPLRVPCVRCAYCLPPPAAGSRVRRVLHAQCLGHALRVAAAVRDLRAAGDEPVRVHAHFAHDPALVGMLVARLTGLPFSFTAHARDLYEIPAPAWPPGRGRPPRW